MRQTQPPTPAALYARVSSDRQDMDLSVAAQLRALRNYAKANGYTIAREGRVPSSIRVRSQAFCGILRTCGHPACGAHGVPLRATALSWSRILRITATTATFPGFPR